MTAKRRGQRTNFAAAADRTQRTGPATKRPAEQLRTTPVRITVDLDPELYDEMWAVASRGLYRGWGSDDLNDNGIGFSLFELPALAA